MALDKSDLRTKQLLHIALVAPFFQYPNDDHIHPDVAVQMDQIKNIFSALANPSEVSQKAHLYILFTKILADLLEKDLADALENADDIEEAIMIFCSNLAEMTDLADSMTAANETQEVGNENADEAAGEEGGNVDGGQRGAQMQAILNEMRGKLNGLQNQLDEEVIAKKAAEFGVRPEIYRYFLEVENKYKDEIKSLRKTFVQFLLRDYKKAWVKGQKDGMLTEPGREVETYERIMSGEYRPRTQIDRRCKKYPRSVQLYKLIDTSSSMITDMEGTLAFYLIVTLAIEGVQDELYKNANLYDVKKLVHNPVEIELTGFASHPTLIIPLAKNLDKTTIVRGFQYIHDTTGGGTDDARALKFEYSRMALQKRDVLKILSMITDGGGQGKAVEPILRQIEEDPGVYFIVNGVGSGAGFVKRFYAEKFRPAHHFHVYAEESATVELAIPKLIHFIQECVRSHFTKV